METTLNGLAWHRTRMDDMKRQHNAGPGVTAATIRTSERRAARREAAELAGIDAELGDDGTVYLVSCASQKQDQAAPARELYTSALFRKAKALAERSGQPWCILSAQHGLVDPDQVLAPYDATVAGKPADVRASWAQCVNTQLANRFRGRARRFVVLAGAAYAGCLGDLPAEYPLQGMQVGERLRELNRLLG